MSTFQKLGGCIALFGAAKIVLGIAGVLTLLASTGYGTGTFDAELFIAFLADNQAVIYIWKLIIWVVWGVLLVVLVLALDERLKGGSPVVARVATAFGLIWAALEIAGGMISTSGIGAVVSLFASNPVQAASLWLALDSVERG